ncbi:MAG: efflux RND transporter periplasmic adaptor subunit [Myxococcales bacterium]|nr:efflux RND transporter periplasmic adaptor subunit [Myxococcales bacterium]MCB9576492.1 efflux RND transporter periplasmic adaptor subunit [Polyangiaceae bacterium]
MTDDIQNGTQPGLVADAVRELEGDLKSESGGRRWLRRLLVVGVVVGLLVAFVAWRRATRPPPEPRFKTEKIEKRDVVEQVQSTGSVKPLTEVQVGAQVSGRVVRVLVDFNSVVKKGDLLAEIDPSLFGAQVSQAGAQLRASKASEKRAEARLATAKINLNRLKGLQKEGIASSADVDSAQGEFDVAEADVSAAKAQISQIQAQLRSARTTLAYSRIYSPIDGVVINRTVEPGQTVAASFAAPVLFVIAQDLSKMQVLADIDEADVGKVEKGMKADVVVDAFPGEKFAGEVTQIRYAPNNVQGVVTYSAVIDVANPDLKLRPGMTATVTIKTHEAKQVLAVRNAALRFRPLPEKDEDGKPKPEKPPAPLEHGQGRLYQITGGAQGSETIAPKVVPIGITDGVWTALKASDLSAGAEVVVEQREEDKKAFGLF